MNCFMTLFSPWKWARRCLRPTGSWSRRQIRERPTFRPRLEVLEDRTLLTVYLVTLATDANFNGGGQQDNTQANSGDLRYCLTQADKGAGNTITFTQKVTLNTINLQAALPDVTQSMTIAPAAGVSVTVERSPNAKSNFRIFTIDQNTTVTFGLFVIQKGFLDDGNFLADAGAGILNEGTLTLNQTRVYNNLSDGQGGGVYNSGNLTLMGASITANQADEGGGIYNEDSLAMVAGAGLGAGGPTVLSKNQADTGAAIYNNGAANLNDVRLFTNIAQDDGGGIYNAQNCSLRIQNSTLQGNKAINGNGGGIFNGGSARINQNTFTGNSAGLQGGAIKNDGTASGKSNTVNGNQVTGIPGALAANETGGGISNDPGATFSLVNSIVAQNTAPTNPDVDGNFNDLGHNFVGTGTGGDFINGSNGDQVGTSLNPLNPMLGPLQDNGGGILTELPLAGSPVIDAGDNSYALATDARGFVRIINGIIDLGAVEYNSNPAPLLGTSVSLSSSANSALPNQEVTFTATVNGMSGTPTGSVTFMDGADMLGTAMLDSNGNATLVTSGLTLGSQIIVAIYSGDVTFAGSNGSLTQTVNQGGTFTSLSLSANPVQPGQAVTFTANIVPEGSSGTPTGIVTFLDGTTALGTGTLAVVGGQDQAAFTTSSLSNGSHTITAIYSGDDTFMSSSSSMSETVGQASGAGSTTSVTSSANSSYAGQSVTFTASVGGNSGTPTGTVTFLDNTTVLGTAALDANGNANLTTAALGLGSNDIVTVYSGDGTYAGSAATLTQSVVQAASTSSLSSSASSSPLGQPVTFTVVVGSLGSYTGTPTGSVSFYDGTTLLGTATLSVVNGQVVASFTTAAMGLGTHNIVAIYSGDGTFADSESSLTQTITN